MIGRKRVRALVGRSRGSPRTASQRQIGPEATAGATARRSAFSGSAAWSALTHPSPTRRGNGCGRYSTARPPRLVTRQRRRGSASSWAPRAFHGLELIEEGADVGTRLRAAFESSPEADTALAAALDLLASFAATGRPAKKWRAEAERVRGLLLQPSAFVGSLLDAALDAADTVDDRFDPAHGGDYTIAWYVTSGTELFLCGTAVFAGVVGDAALPNQLQRLAVKSIAIIGKGLYIHPRSLRIANACAQAIADIETASSITELLALERVVRHGTLLKQIRKAIDALAAAQGMTRGELLERAVEDHGVDPNGTRIVPLSRGSALMKPTPAPPRWSTSTSKGSGRSRRRRT